MHAMLAAAALAVSQSFVLSTVVKVSALFAVAWVGVGLLRHARASVRHAVLAATFAGVVALPLGAAFGPALDVPVAPPAATASTALTATATAIETAVSAEPGPVPARRLPAVGELALAVWALGACAFGIPLLRGSYWLSRLRRSALPWPELTARARHIASARRARRPVEVVRHEAIPAPVTFGASRPVVMLPADALAWSDADLDRALVHELEHIRRHDWIVLMAARTVCAVYWFHPLTWWAWRRLGLEAERACDDAVVADVEASTYARQLVDLASRLTATSATPAVGMARRSDLSTRVAAVLDAAQPRGRAGTAVVCATFGVSLVLVGVVSPLRAVMQAADVVAADLGPAAPPQERRQRALDAELYEAASEGDRQGVTDLLDAGANVNARLLGDGSALIAAARRGDLALARLLVARGADPNLDVRGDGSALIAAAGNGLTALVTFLLDSGAHVDQVVDGDENALIQASREGHLPAVQVLVARGADVNLRVLAPTYQGGTEWRTPLGMARRGRHDAVARFLVASGARQ